MFNFERLESLSRRFDEIEAALANPGDTFDQARFTALVRERSALEETVAAYRAHAKLLAELRDNEALLSDKSDPELHALAEEEAHALSERRTGLEAELTELMVPRDPDDDKDVFVEIRAGAGGDEAGLFAAELARLYVRYAESLGMHTEILSQSDNDAGGVKEIVLGIRGGEPYRFFKYESGVHRVQRVPATESQGRVHTSTATVAVLLEVDDDAAVEINPKDLQIDTFKSSGAGGQHVNKTESAIRITHVPSGVVVSCSEERSQLQNRERAMTMLRSVLADRKRREAEEAVGSLRRSQVGTGDRSEKIRTYNFPQDRITDHRINENFGNARDIMDGNLGRIVARLQQDEKSRRLAGDDAAA
ncbi:MAG: peptide chain release factor 1 [Candidatus Eremiobacteraeota bacterium]|nr:peptide chain release factor 1 [Candidatus Eremiobacteraeota bacterium]MBC5802168.1 peptide chain release factor 1 [Candidatus Eremiobacteraeota bacterium]MBC5821780.1 peptide chain release factor 1 [Candidatus Eremiobacteraeota bacterium]